MDNNKTLSETLKDLEDYYRLEALLRQQLAEKQAEINRTIHAQNMTKIYLQNKVILKT